MFADNRLLKAIIHALRRNVVVLLLLAIVILMYVVSNQQPPVELPVENQQATLTLTHSEPIRIYIPAIGVYAAFETPLGIGEGGEIEVPKSFNTVGWYKYGPTPGELGPAVVLGHVDSYKGPEVFYKLRELKEGDRILINREDGTTATFVVERLETVSQSAFPTEEVYGNIEYAGLRLITCSGTYDHGTERYSHNLIVFAHLVDDSTQKP